LSTLFSDTGEIGSIASSGGQIVVSAATFLAGQSTLDKIVEGFDVSDDANTLVAALPTLNADSKVDAITADVGEGTLSRPFRSLAAAARSISLTRKIRRQG
jgi:hypothetical protein